VRIELRTPASTRPRVMTESSSQLWNQRVAKKPIANTRMPVKMPISENDTVPIRISVAIE